MIRELVKADIKNLLKQANDDAEVNFLKLFDSYRTKVVYGQKLFTEEEFDDLCWEVLNESDKKKSE